ncbi:UNVERIFIED_CONTAM: hypothetical protein FKN15_075712 [Acipenser sinensis]
MVSAEKVSSLGKNWHRFCLKCERCNKTLSAGNHAEHDGMPYCHKPCYATLFGPKGVNIGGAGSYIYETPPHTPVNKSMESPTECSPTTPWTPAQTTKPFRPENSTGKTKNQLSILVSCHPRLFGGFYIHIENPADGISKNVSVLLESLYLTQYISLPTHSKGHTIDVVMGLGLSPSNILLPPLSFTDHFLIYFKIDLPIPAVMVQTVLF